VFLKETPTTVGLPEKKREKGRGKERGERERKGGRGKERERKKGDTREAATTYSRIY